MRILLTGFLLLVIWTVLSTCLYVNKIRNSIVVPTVVQADTIVALPQVLKAVMPEKLEIYFDTNKWDFITGTESDTLFSGFKVYVEQNPESKISIIGHADASGSKAHNFELGNKRAQSVRDHLVTNGIPSDKIILISRGEDEPVADNNTVEGKAKNRRSEITIK